MLHKSKSEKMNAYKFAIVLPLLVLFVFNFNTKVIAQTKEASTESSKIGQNVLKYVINKNTKDSQLESIKENLAKNKVIVDFKNLKRNDRKEITGIKINYESNVHNGNYVVNSENPIEDIEIAFNVNEHKLMVGQAKKNLSQSFDIIKEDGKVELKKESTESDVIVHSTDDNNPVNDTIKVIGKDGKTYEVTKAKKTYIIKSNATKTNTQNDDSPYIKKSKNDTIWIKSDVKNIIWTNDDGEEIEIMATQRDNNNIRIFASDNENPLILLNGKEITKKELQALNPEDIETVNVIKGEKAIKAYGQKAKDGVIDIHLKKKE